MLVVPAQTQQFGLNRSTKNILQQVHPLLQPSKLRKVTVDKTLEQRLIQLDEVQLFTRYKFGVLYCKSGQKTEEEMFGNGKEKIEGKGSRWLTE